MLLRKRHMAEDIARTVYYAEWAALAVMIGCGVFVLSAAVYTGHAIPPWLPVYWAAAVLATLATATYTRRELRQARDGAAPSGQPSRRGANAFTMRTPDMKPYGMRRGSHAGESTRSPGSPADGEPHA